MKRDRFDMDGNRITLKHLTEQEPAWACNVILTHEKTIKEQAAHIERLRESLMAAMNINWLHPDITSNTVTKACAILSETKSQSLCAVKAEAILDMLSVWPDSKFNRFNQINDYDIEEYADKLQQGSDTEFLDIPKFLRTGKD